MLDIIVAGGGLSGLLAAREAAQMGAKVQVIEQDIEIGQPERCDGLVSGSCLRAIGVKESGSLVQNRIAKAELVSPGGERIMIDASRQGVIVLDRSELDLELAKQAWKAGASLELGKRVGEIRADGGDTVTVRAGSISAAARYVIDARGTERLIEAHEGAVLQAAKYEVHGSWFSRDTVELYFDQEATPGFFKWVIPISESMAKVGAAGRGINPFRVLDRFIAEKGGVVLKKIAAPVVISGPVTPFVTGRVLRTGDAAGQTKPTTAGGIYSGGWGGMLAGRSSAAAASAEGEVLGEYERRWMALFGKEFRTTARVRAILQMLSNSEIDVIFHAVGESGIAAEISDRGDFDFHSGAIRSLLTSTSVAKIGPALVKAGLWALISWKKAG